MSNRSKWAGKRDNLCNNDVVIVKNETAVPSLWELGRVVQVFPGANGLVQAARIKTKYGLIKQPI